MSDHRRRMPSTAAILASDNWREYLRQKIDDSIDVQSVSDVFNTRILLPAPLPMTPCLLRLYIYYLLDCVRTIHNGGRTCRTSRPRRPTDSSLNYQVSDLERKTSIATGWGQLGTVLDRTPSVGSAIRHPLTVLRDYTRSLITVDTAKRGMYCCYRPSVPPIAVLNEESVFYARLSN